MDRRARAHRHYAGTRAAMPAQYHRPGSARVIARLIPLLARRENGADTP
jgi:hypothetical protein